MTPPDMSTTNRHRRRHRANSGAGTRVQHAVLRSDVVVRSHRYPDLRAGPGLLPPIGHLNITQAFMVMVVAGLVFVVMLSLNGRAGLDYGIPFSIQTRSHSASGARPSSSFCGALPAIIWYGIGSWIAALAIDGILKTRHGLQPTRLAVRLVPGPAGRADLAGSPGNQDRKGVQRRGLRHHHLRQGLSADPRARHLRLSRKGNGHPQARGAHPSGKG